MKRPVAGSGKTGSKPDHSSSPENGLLSRWEQRKRRVWEESQQGEEAGKAPRGSDRSVTVPDSVMESADDPDANEAVALTDADMPPIASLCEDSDFSGFMSPGVSEELRRLALRKLFQASSFNVCDGLDDYDEDFTSFEKLGDIVTADMKHQWQLEECRRTEDNAELVEGQAAANPDHDDQPAEVEPPAAEPPSTRSDTASAVAATEPTTSSEDDTRQDPGHKVSTPPEVSRRDRDDA